MEDITMKLYWVSAIVQNKDDKNPWLRAMSEGELSIGKAMTVIDRLKANNTVLSVWIDVFDENGIKDTVYHDCYINAFGDLM